MAKIVYDVTVSGTFVSLNSWTEVVTELSRVKPLQLGREVSIIPRAVATSRGELVIKLENARNRVLEPTARTMIDEVINILENREEEIV